MQSPYILRSALRIPKERQRQEFDANALQELQASIELNGLLHAPVIRHTAEGPTLVAGESRIKAIDDIRALGGSFRYNGQTVPDDSLPVVTLGDLSPLQAEEAELDENLKRKDLTWQEHAAAVKRLMLLRQAQAVAAAPAGTVPALPTITSLAQEVYGNVGVYTAKASADLILADNLSNPSIAKAGSAKEAFKILKAQDTRRRNEELAAIVGPTFGASSHRLAHADCLPFMRDPANHGQFDVILTDPPYGMGADGFGDANGRLVHQVHNYSDGVDAWRTLMRDWARLSFQCAADQAHAYLFCDIDNFHELKAMMEAGGWYVFRTPFVYQKLNSGRVPRPEHGPRRQYELVLYAIKGDKRVTQIYPDVFAATGDTNLGHGAQKPVASFQNLLQRSVKPGDKVFDPFCGTGTIFEACHPFKCQATGIEMDAGSYGIALRRLQALDGLETADTLLKGLS